MCRVCASDHMYFCSAPKKDVDKLVMLEIEQSIQFLEARQSEQMTVKRQKKKGNVETSTAPISSLTKNVVPSAKIVAKCVRLAIGVNVKRNVSKPQFNRFKHKYILQK